MRHVLVILAVGLLAIEPALGQSPRPETVPAPAVPAPSADPASPPVVLAMDEGDGCCGERVWFQAAYMLSWIKGASVGPALLTTDPSNGATATAGGLADPTTQVLIGGNVGYNSFSGARFDGGYVLQHGLAIEGGGFFTGTQVRNYVAASDATGNPFLFRPFLNVDTGNANAGSIVAFPGLINGAVAVASQSQVWGMDVRVAGNVIRNDRVRLDAYTGFRYLDLHEKIEINDARTDLAGIGNFGGPPTAAGDRFLFQDSFSTRNQFYGGQVGVRGEVQRGRVAIAGNVGVALGDSKQIVDIVGATTLFPAAGGAATLPGGVLALPSNSGRFVYHDFAVVPEVRVQVGYDVRSWLRLGVGYDFLYWSAVSRPGDQIVPVVSAGQLPSSPTFGTGSAVPPPPHISTDFWMQGIDFYVAVRF